MAVNGAKRDRWGVARRLDLSGKPVRAPQGPTTRRGYTGYGAAVSGLAVPPAGRTWGTDPPRAPSCRGAQQGAPAGGAGDGRVRPGRVPRSPPRHETPFAFWGP